MEAGFPDALCAMDATLNSQLGPRADGEFLYYDELRSVEGSIRYSPINDIYRNLGNLAGQLCISFNEVGADNIRNGTHTILNAYENPSRTLCTLLGNRSMIYARGTWGITADATPHMDESGSLQHGKLSTSGLYILIPTMTSSKDIAKYHDAITTVAEKLSNEKSKAFLGSYAKTAVKYALMTKTGKAVSVMVDSGTPKEQIDYAKVREYWENNTIPVLDIAGNPVEKQIWSHCIKDLYDRFPGTQDEATLGSMR